MRKISLFLAIATAVLSVTSLCGAEPLKGRLITADDIESKQDKNSYVLREFQNAAERSALYVLGGKHRAAVASKDGYSIKNLNFLAPYIKRMPVENKITMPPGSNLSATVDRFVLRMGAISNNYKDLYAVIHEDCTAAKCSPIKQTFEEGDRINKVPITESQAKNLNSFFNLVTDVNKLSKDLEKDLNILEREMTKVKRTQRESDRKANKGGAILGSSPLIAAAADGTPPELIRTIAKEKERLKDGFSINATNSMGDTALIGLCRNNKTGNLSVLLREKPDINLVNSKEESALMVASMHNNPTLLRQLFKLNPDLNAQNNVGETALHYAVKNDAAESIKLLLEQKADASLIDKAGNTPLAYSISKGKLPAFKVLLAVGEWTAVVKDGKNAIQLVIESKNLPMFEEMVKSFNVNEQSFPNGEALSHVVARIKNEKSVEQFTVLVGQKANLNILNNNAETPLHLAVISDNLPLAKYLLEQKVNLEIQSNDGFFAKDLAKSDAMKKLFTLSAPVVEKAVEKSTKVEQKIEKAAPVANTEEEAPKSKKKWWFIGIGGALVLIFLLKK